MTTNIVGMKIRELRKASGISQKALAKRMGISPAYLNLIEFSKRSIDGDLLEKAAECLDVRPAELEGVPEQRLLSELIEISADPDIRDIDIDAASAEEFIGRFFGWATALAEISRLKKANQELVTVLSDRLTHDPYLSDIVHQMLTYLSSIRSTSEILDDVSDLDAPQRQRFYKVLATDSARLSDVTGSLAQYFDMSRKPERSAAPVEEIETVLLSRRNHFEDIEAEAEQCRHQLDAEITARAGNREMAARSVAAEGMRDVIRSIVKSQSDRLSPVSKKQFSKILQSYAEDALLLPADDFHKSAVANRYDLEKLSHDWQVGHERVCRRLTAVSGHQWPGPRFAYMKVNAAGQTVDRRPLVELPLPLYGPACPLWSIYRAFSAPGVLFRQIAQFPDERRMLFVARARRAFPAHFSRPSDFVSDMIAIPMDQADQTLYTDGLAQSEYGSGEPVGAHCKICTRIACQHRTDDPLVGRAGGRF